MSANLLAFVLSRLDERIPSWTEVSLGAGVPYSTLKKIAARVTPNPGVQHVQRLADFFEAYDSASPRDRQLVRQNGEGAHA